MVALQILCKCMSAGNINLIEDNQLTSEYFTGYEEEFQFLVDHYKQYGNTPDTVTFLSKFPEDEIVAVTESDRYLVDAIREEHLYTLSVPVVKRIAELLKTDANAAVEYMLHATKELRPDYRLGGTDIIAQAGTRYDEFIDRKEKQDKWFFTSGFPELDSMIHGIQRTEEFIVIFARTNQGKSWVLEKICTHIWEIGFNVGYVSPEMTASSIGYRFDTLYHKFDNKGLMWSNDTISEDNYKQYTEQLQQKNNRFVVATMNDFDRRLTVTKLKNWIKQYRLDVVAVDGITYLTDERGKRGDNKTTALTNISEDLMSLSIELGVPILVTVQANRAGIAEKGSDDLPELENIRDSDGISFNASKVISLRQNKSGELVLQVKKQRNGMVGGKIAYKWNANIGEFINIPMDNDTVDADTQNSRKNRAKTAKEDVF